MPVSVPTSENTLDRKRNPRVTSDRSIHPQIIFSPSHLCAISAPRKPENHMHSSFRSHCPRLNSQRVTRWGKGTSSRIWSEIIVKLITGPRSGVHMHKLCHDGMPSTGVHGLPKIGMEVYNRLDRRLISIVHLVHC